MTQCFFFDFSEIVTLVLGGLLPTSFLKVPTSFLLGAEKLITDELFYYVTNWHAFDERFIT